MMKRTATLLAACCVVCSAHAEYSVSDTGAWPKSWPKELEPLRKQSRTLEGPRLPMLHYQIPFTSREEFEAAWPHLLKVKSKGAPIILVRGPKTDFFAIKPAGLLIHAPPANTDRQVNPEAPTSSTSTDERWMWTTYFMLVVDGNIVVLNRIPLPADTPIIDERFKDGQPK